ncbi:hypothetical protein EPUL_001386 [Erysiphe pulchra]|uniref:Phenylalanine--tRNA ligase, mitochondrial n=1 Tax=Erysiphe pulchra TaxID=225359 RepID=A0A2S4PWN5_9PEZI|nr:hypothetical protein EPUL_001386 [Erysiphe pulchra]
MRPLKTGHQILNKHFVAQSHTIEVDQKHFNTDSWTNVPHSILSSIPHRLHLLPNHPISLTRSVIESCFPTPSFLYYNTLSPAVTTYQNFDSLGFPPDHPGRSKSDTYYINASTVLRTHTSAHQADLFRANSSRGYLVSADVYRRDAIDRNHYPIFHQMEGGRTWDRRDGDIITEVSKDIQKLPKHDMIIMDPNHPMHPIRNPLQSEHKHEEAEAITVHLKRSLEVVIFEIFSRANRAASYLNHTHSNQQIKVRWVEAYFPFTSPSWELEVFWQDEWLEVLGCGIVKQSILNEANVPDQIGWAFGIGLERIAMLLFGIPDIRLFWSKDSRFLDQFKGLSVNLDNFKGFVPFSKYPGTYKDMSFWIQDILSANRSDHFQETCENDIMQIVRDVAGDTVESVRKVDAFKHPKTGRTSWCYRVNYRSLEKTLTGNEANMLHEAVKRELVNKLGVEFR